MLKQFNLLVNKVLKKIMIHKWFAFIYLTISSNKDALSLALSRQFKIMQKVLQSFPRFQKVVLTTLSIILLMPTQRDIYVR